MIKAISRKLYQDVPMDAKVRARIRKLMGKLGSDYDGERASAAHLCTKLLLQHRLTWADVVAGKLESGGQDADRTLEQGYLRGYQDGFRHGVKCAQQAAEAAGEPPHWRTKAVRRELTDRETAMLTWLTTAVSHCPKAFSAFEQNFVLNVSDQYQRFGSLSEKQITCLTDIYRRRAAQTNGA
jgi:hypothetical protein